jgi:hypothetical protein
MRRHITPSFVLSLMALFVALGGSSYAAVKLKANSVGSREIRNGSVTLSDLSTSIRPSKSNKLFRAAVVDTVTDPASGVTDQRAVRARHRRPAGRCRCGWRSGPVRYGDGDDARGVRPDCRSRRSTPARGPIACPARRSSAAASTSKAPRATGSCR